jgi:hypothetical protein
MRHWLLLTAVLAGALGFGCSDQPGVTDPDPGPPSLAAEISRFEIVLDPSFSDGEITVFFGVGFEELPAVCAGAEPQTLGEIQIVTHPTRQGGTSEHVLIKATELNVIVFAVPGFPGIDRCDFQGVQPLAVGTVHALLNDNEGQFFETAPGANAFINRFEGNLTNPETGQRYHLQAAVQIVVLPDGTFTFPPVPFLRLTPIGG